MPIINNLVMHVDGQNTIVYPNTVGEAVYMNILNHYTLPDALNDLRNNAVSQWNDISGKPFSTLKPSDFVVVDGQLRLAGSFTAEWNSIENKPSVFPTSWSRISGKPGSYPTTWEDIEGIPSYMPSTWENIYNKPTYYNTDWDLINNKPDYFNADWFYINSKPFNYINNNYLFVDEENEMLSFNDVNFLKLQLLNEQLNQTSYLVENIITINNNSQNNQQENYGSLSIKPIYRVIDGFNSNGFQSNDNILNMGAIQIADGMYYYNYGVYIPSYNGGIGRYTIPQADAYKFFQNLKTYCSYGSVNLDFNPSNLFGSINFTRFDVSLIDNASYMFDGFFDLTSGAYHDGTINKVAIDRNTFINGKNFYHFLNGANSSILARSWINLEFSGNWNTSSYYGPFINFYEVVNCGDAVGNIIFKDFYIGYSDTTRLINTNYKSVTNLNYYFRNASFYCSQSYSGAIDNGFLSSQYSHRPKKIYIENNFNLIYSTSNNAYFSYWYDVLMSLAPLYEVHIDNSEYYQDFLRILCASNISPNYQVYIPNTTIYFNNCSWFNFTAGFGGIRNNQSSSQMINVYINNIKLDNWGMLYNINLQSPSINCFIINKNNFGYIEWDSNVLFNNVICNHDLNFNLESSRLCDAPMRNGIIKPKTGYRTNNLNIFYKNLYFSDGAPLDVLFNNVKINFNSCTLTKIRCEYNSINSNLFITGDINSLGMLSNIVIAPNLYNFCIDMNLALASPSMEIFRYEGPSQDSNATTSYFYLPIESPSIYFSYNRFFNIAYQQQKKYIYILKDSGLDKMWQNTAVLAKNLFNINAENIPENFVKTTMTNGYYFPNYNLYIYNGNYICNNYYLNTGWYPPSSIPIENIQNTDIIDTVLVEEDLIVNDNIVYANNIWSTGSFNAYFNKLDNKLYLYTNNINNVYLTGYMGISSFMVGTNYTYKNVYNIIKKKPYVHYALSGDQTIIHGLNYEGATELGSWYSGCGNLIEATIPSTALNIDSAFVGCSNLINLPDCPISVQSMNTTFQGLANIQGTPVINRNVLNAISTFAGCSNLTGTPVILSENVIMTATFSGCSNLNGVLTIGKARYISGGPFSGTNIEELVIGGLSPMYNGSSGDNLIAGMNNLKRLSFNARFMSQQYGNGNIVIPKLEYIKVLNNNEPGVCSYDLVYGLNYNCPMIVYPPMLNQINTNSAYNYILSPNLVISPSSGSNGDPSNGYMGEQTLGNSVSNITIYGVGNYRTAYTSRYYNFSAMQNLIMDGYPEKIYPNDGGSDGIYFPSGLSNLLYGVLPYKSREDTNVSYFNTNGYQGCSNLLFASLIEDYNNFAMTAVNSGYIGCPNLVTIIGPSGKYGQNMSYGMGFDYNTGSGLSNLRYIVAGTYSPIKNIGSGCFSGCPNLIRFFGRANNVYNAFSGSPNITLENCPFDQIGYSFGGSGTGPITSNRLIYNIYNSFGGSGYNSINMQVAKMYSSFNGSSKLTDVNLDFYDYGTSYGYENNANFCYCFSGCANLKNVNVSYTTNTTSSIYAFYQCFSGCPNLEYVDISRINIPASVNLCEQTYGCNFGGCTHLHTLKVYSLPYYESITFRWCAECKNLQNLEIVNRASIDTVTDFNMAFTNCYLLTDANVIGNNVVNMWSCFNGCHSLINCYCGPNVKEMAFAYKDCYNLAYANIGPNVQNLFGCFGGCINMNKNIYINTPYIDNSFKLYQLLEGDTSKRYNIFVIEGSDTNNSFYNLEGISYSALFVNNNSADDHPAIHWEFDLLNSCYYDINSNIYVYYTL